MYGKIFFDTSVMHVLELTIFKVEAMKVMSFHKVAQGFRLKGSQTRVANLPVDKHTESDKKLSTLLHLHMQ